MLKGHKLEGVEVSWHVERSAAGLAYRSAHSSRFALPSYSFADGVSHHWICLCDPEAGQRLSIRVLNFDLEPAACASIEIQFETIAAKLEYRRSKLTATNPTSADTNPSRRMRARKRLLNVRHRQGPQRGCEPYQRSRATVHRPQG